MGAPGMAKVDQWKERREGVLLAFGQDLKEFRTSVGMTHRELGERSQMHGTEVGLLERGQREPRLLTMLRLAVALDVPFGRLTETPAGRFEYEAARGWPDK
jgi:transcriptional regulator with XRE-family HTH domain